MDGIPWRKSALVALVALVACSAFASAGAEEAGQAQEAAKVQPARWAGKGRIEYVLVHKLHRVVGATEEPEVALVIDESGLKVMARAKVASFKSGNGNRDAHALEAIDAANHPLVVVKGVAPGFKPPATPGVVKVPLKAQVELKGVTVPRDIEVTLDYRSPDRAEATFSFPESLEAHQVERPSLMMIKVEDALEIRGKLALEREP
ncbi:MAG TPA: YceI family protein [Vulgatibacter sp.]|nr:YceI family protein [Vulgatibacter sp.]